MLFSFSWRKVVSLRVMHRFRCGVPQWRAGRLSVFPAADLLEYYPRMEVRCPTCCTRVDWEKSPCRPFCSERCKALDLGRWLAEEYSLPVWEDEETGAEDGGSGPEESDRPC